MANEQQKKENYKAVITANSLYTAATGTPAVALQVQCVKNLRTGEDCEFAMVGYLQLSPRTVDKSIETLREVFDYHEKSFLPLNDPKKLMGKECEITVSLEEYNGEMRRKIQWFNNVGSFSGRMIKPMENAAALSLAQSLDHYFTAPASGNNSYSQNNSGRPAPSYGSGAVAGVPGYNPDDKLPF